MPAGAQAGAVIATSELGTKASDRKRGLISGGQQHKDPAKSHLEVYSKLPAKRSPKVNSAQDIYPYPTPC